MASKRIIEVRITGNGGSGVSEREKSEPQNDIDSNLKVSSLFDNVLVNQVYQGLKGEISEMAMYGINRHLTLTDNYVAERYLTNSLNVITRTISFGGAVLAGFKVGGVAGAVIGAVISGVSTTFDIVKNFDQQNIHIRQMDKQLEYQRQRAGYSLTSGSIGENR